MDVGLTSCCIAQSETLSICDCHIQSAVGVWFTSCCMAQSETQPVSLLYTVSYGCWVHFMLYGSVRNTACFTITYSQLWVLGSLHVVWPSRKHSLFHYYIQSVMGVGFTSCCMAQSDTHSMFDYYIQSVMGVGFTSCCMAQLDTHSMFYYYIQSAVCVGLTSCCIAQSETLSMCDCHIQ